MSDMIDSQGPCHIVFYEHHKSVATMTSPTLSCLGVPLMENIRCAWCLGSPEYIHYHDTEWGIPIYDDQKLFECIVLESAQAGLSWITI